MWFIGRRRDGEAVNLGVTAAILVQFENHSKIVIASMASGSVERAVRAFDEARCRIGAVPGCALELMQNHISSAVSGDLEQSTALIAAAEKGSSIEHSITCLEEAAKGRSAVR